MAQPKPRRVYPLDNRELTEEQIAVAFAMTSRNPEPFDETAKQVSEQRAAGFHERWVLDYGHASVAEHAVVHLAVENISRLACDALEDNRLASYTEKSSRYQIINRDDFHTPAELEQRPGLRRRFEETCRGLFNSYHDLLERTIAHLGRTTPRHRNETDAGYSLRLRRRATDACRGVLPAATLTNAGMTANARTLEHAISKLLSSELAETRELGLKLREQGRSVTPTLIKYANRRDYLVPKPRPDAAPEPEEDPPGPPPEARIVERDQDPALKLAAAILYRSSGHDYAGASIMAGKAGREGQRRIIAQALAGMGDHDAPPREFETVGYTFEFTMDYGALREFRRHRMLTPLSQPLTTAHGVQVPDLMVEAGLERVFTGAARNAERAYGEIQEHCPALAQYTVTHGHRQRVLARMNLRECYHLFRLRTSARAHESIRGPVRQALELARKADPDLFQGIPATPG